MSDPLHALLRLRRHDDLEWRQRPDGSIELWPASPLPAVVAAVGTVLHDLGATRCGERWVVAATHPEWADLQDAVRADPG